MNFPSFIFGVTSTHDGCRWGHVILRRPEVMAIK